MKKTKEALHHERKYLASLKDKYLIHQRVRNVMALDERVKQESYTIRSLYFDDYWNSTYEDKQASVLIRKKYRIRIYNCTDQVIKLERKRRHGAYIYKEDTPLTKEGFYEILGGNYGFLLKSPRQLCRESYVEHMASVLRPRTIVDYEREPRALEAGTMRVTFDENIRTAVGSFDIFDANLPTLGVLGPEKLVSEVKYTGFYLDIIKEIIPADIAKYTAVSKYVLYYDRTDCSRSLSDYWYSN